MSHLIDLLAKGLLERRHEVEMSTASGDALSLLRQIAVPVFNSPLYPSTPINLIRSVIRLTRGVHVNGIDMLHSHLVFDNHFMKAVLRREKYLPRIYRDGYFVIKHLQLFVSRQLEHLITPGCLVGDIGCGEQPLREQVEAMGGIYTGIDVEQNSQNTVQVITSIVNVPWPDSYFDVILCTEVLEHVPHTYGAFRELARLLKPGGRLMITVPFTYPLHEEPFDFVRLTFYQIRECARNNQLGIVTLETCGNEVEVMANVWSNMWGEIVGDRESMVLRLWSGLMRIPVNLLAVAISTVMGSTLPKKSYLNTLCILEKRSCN